MCCRDLPLALGLPFALNAVVRTDTFCSFSCPLRPQSVTGFRVLDRRFKVNVTGSIEKLWHNCSHGVHRVSCYGDVLPDLKRLCRFKGIELLNEAWTEYFKRSSHSVQTAC